MSLAQQEQFPSEVNQYVKKQGDTLCNVISKKGGKLAMNFVAAEGIPCSTLLATVRILQCRHTIRMHMPSISYIFMAILTIFLGTPAFCHIFKNMPCFLNAI